MNLTSIGGVVAGIGGLLFLLFIGTSSRHTTQQQQLSAAELRTRVVATVGTRSIRLAEVEQAVALSLHQLEEQRTKLLRESTQRIIEEELLVAEAARVGVTIHDLIEQAGESEVIAKLAGFPGPIRLTSTSSPSPFISEELSRIRRALLVQLRRNAQVHLNLPEPELPVLDVSPDDDPWTGTAQAPVTIIEFSDFECPYCRNSVPVLKELLAKYPGKLRLVYRDFPGPNHQQALWAAQAAQCASEQGRFWEYHDALFNRLPSESAWNFSNLAETLSLSLSPFNACVQNNRYREEVLKDLQDGLKLGVTSTPTFFINGRPLVGARPLADFQAIIEKLLLATSSP